MRPRLIGAAALGAAALLGLAACGGATVDNDATGAAEQTVAPLTRAPQQSSTTAAPSSSAAAAPAASDSGTGRDQGAREISEIPEPASPYTAEEQRLLDRIADQGIDTAGVEAQLIETGNLICAQEGGNTGGEITAAAIAGQLVEQGKTTLAPADAAAVIVDSTRDAYC